MKDATKSMEDKNLEELLKTKCKNCGADVKVESTSELFECPFCGSSYISDEAKYTKIPDEELKRDLRKIYLLGWTKRDFSWYWFFKSNHLRWQTLFDNYRLLRWIRYEYYANKKFNFFYRWNIESQLATKILIFRNKIINESHLYLLAYFQKLTLIDFTGSTIQDHHLMYLYPLKLLQSINLHNTSISDKGLVYLRRFKNLESVFLTETNVTEKGLINLVDLPHLKEIGFSFPHLQEKVNMIEVLRAGGSKMFSDAKSLSLKMLDVKDEDLKYLEFFPQITSLDLSDNQIYGSGLSNLRFCKDIQCLYLSHNPINDENLEYLKQLKRLDQLNLRQTRITNKGAEELKKFLPDGIDFSW